MIQTIVAQPQAARFITAKVWNYFTDQVPSPELTTAMATVFRAYGNDFQTVSAGDVSAARNFMAVTSCETR